MPERVAYCMSATSPDVRILDRHGAKYRNATVAAGAVRGLKRPVLLMPPAIEETNLAKALAAMQFVTCRALK
jgi:hypothetical protein